MSINKSFEIEENTLSIEFFCLLEMAHLHGEVSIAANAEDYPMSNIELYFYDNDVLMAGEVNKLTGRMDVNDIQLVNSGDEDMLGCWAESIKKAVLEILSKTSGVLEAEVVWADGEAPEHLSVINGTVSSVHRGDKEKKKHKWPKITADNLRALHPCSDEYVQKFEKLFPNGARVSPNNIITAFAAGLDICWFALETLSPEGYLEFRDVYTEPFVERKKFAKLLAKLYRKTRRQEAGNESQSPE